MKCEARLNSREIKLKGFVPCGAWSFMEIGYFLSEGGAREEVRRSPETLVIMLWGLWISRANVMEIQPFVFDISKSKLKGNLPSSLKGTVFTLQFGQTAQQTAPQVEGPTLGSSLSPDHRQWICFYYWVKSSKTFHCGVEEVYRWCHLSQLNLQPGF